MEETKQPDIKISQFIKQFHGISKQSRAKYLNMTFTYNIVTLLYVYNELVPIDAKRNRFKELCTFVNSRVVRHKEYFYNNPKICGTYSFLKKVIDNLSES